MEYLKKIYNYKNNKYKEGGNISWDDMSSEYKVPDESPVRTANQNKKFIPRQVEEYQKAKEEFPIEEIEPVKKAIINNLVKSQSFKPLPKDAQKILEEKKSNPNWNNFKGNYQIFSKENSNLYLFDNNHNLIDVTPAGRGKGLGDNPNSTDLSKPLQNQEKLATTPSGRYSLHEYSPNYANKEFGTNKVYSFAPTKTGGVLAEHGVYKGDYYNRIKIINDPKIKQKYVSYGCLNIPADFLNKHDNEINSGDSLFISKEPNMKFKYGGKLSKKAEGGDIDYPPYSFKRQYMLDYLSNNTKESHIDLERINNNEVSNPYTISTRTLKNLDNNLNNPNNELAPTINKVNSLTNNRINPRTYRQFDNESYYPRLNDKFSPINNNLNYSDNPFNNNKSSEELYSGMGNRNINQTIIDNPSTGSDTTTSEQLADTKYISKTPNYLNAGANIAPIAANIIDSNTTNTSYDDFGTKYQKQSVLGAAGADVLRGASLGASFGPEGAAIGAGIGAIYGGVSSYLGNKDVDKQKADAEKRFTQLNHDQSDMNYKNAVAQGFNPQGNQYSRMFKKGGDIKRPIYKSSNKTITLPEVEIKAKRLQQGDDVGNSEFGYPDDGNNKYNFINNDINISRYKQYLHDNHERNVEIERNGLTHEEYYKKYPNVDSYYNDTERPYKKWSTLIPDLMAKGGRLYPTKKDHKETLRLERLANGGVPNPEYEVEDQEVIQGNDTQLEGNQEDLASDMTKGIGATHENGGIQGQGGERVFSDRIKIGDMLYNILKENKVSVSPNATYANVAELLGRKKGKFEKKLESKEPITYKTGKVMTNRFDNLIEATFQEQELTKELENKDMEAPSMFKYGGIHINPANKGKFNALKARTGKSTEELTHSKNPLTRKRAIFAQNAKHFKHPDGGYLNKVSNFAIDNPEQVANALVYFNNLNNIDKQQTNINRQTPNPLYIKAPNYLNQNLYNIDSNVNSTNKAITNSSSNIQDIYNRRSDIFTKGLSAKNEAIMNQGRIGLEANNANVGLSNQFNLLKTSNLNEDQIDKLMSKNAILDKKNNATNSFLQGIMGNIASKRAYQSDQDRMRLYGIDANRGTTGRFLDKFDPSDPEFLKYKEEYLRNRKSTEFHSKGGYLKKPKMMKSY